MDYEAYQQIQEQRFEAQCRRCGACCGSQDDPCAHLEPDGSRYRCAIYETRRGERRTRRGKTFRCVSLRDMIDRDWPGAWACAYHRDRIALVRMPGQ